MKYEQMLEEGLEKIFEALVGDNGLLKQRLKKLTTNPDEGLGGNAIQDLVNEIHRLKDIEYKYENETKKDFKDGVHDGLWSGYEMKTTTHTITKKGMTLVLDFIPRLKRCKKKKVNKFAEVHYIVKKYEVKINFIRGESNEDL